MKIGFIGTGNMGSAIIRAICGKDGLTLYGLNRTRSALEALAAETGLVPCDDVRELTEKSDYIVLAVKPQQVHEVWPEMLPALTRGKCLISIAAGLTLNELKDNTHRICPVIRVMPNTTVLIREGVTAVCLDDPALTGEQKQVVQDVFRVLGGVHALPENQFDAFTAVIGSGPAYIFYLIESMIEAAVEIGLDRNMSSSMVKKLFSGAGQLAYGSNEHISILKDMSTAPAGTTVAGLAHFDRTAVRGNIIDAIRKAFDRSIEMGRGMNPRDAKGT